MDSIRDEERFEQIALGYPSLGESGNSLTRAKNFRDFISKRRSVRQFSSTPVDAQVIEACISAAGSAPSGANRQPWHFVAVSDFTLKREIRASAEGQDRKFYSSEQNHDWLRALSPIGTAASKKHLEQAPWLIVPFAQSHGPDDSGRWTKNYYVNESLGISVGILLATLHAAGLGSVVHKSYELQFLGDLLERPESERAYMIIATGYPAEGATVPAAAAKKKSLENILTLW